MRTNAQYGTNPEGWEGGPREIVIKTSNVCNLACRTCAGWDTSYYWPEGKYYTETYATTRVHNGVRKPGNDFVQVRDKQYHRADLWKIEDLQNVEKLSFFGGEPLLDKQHSILLQRIVDADRAKDTTLFYSTNGQQIGSHYEHLWAQFKRVEIFFSIDGVGSAFEYLRWPGNWEKTQRNIDWFVDLPNRYPSVDWYFQGSQCVSLINIADYQTGADWIEQRLGAVHFNIVDHPRHYRMTNIPDRYKQELANTIKHQQIANYLTIESANINELKRMIIWIKRQDLYRKQDYAKTFPNTYDLLAEHWHTVTEKDSTN